MSTAEDMAWLDEWKVRAAAASDRVAALHMSRHEISTFVNYLAGAAPEAVDAAATYIERRRVERRTLSDSLGHPQERCGSRGFADDRVPGCIRLKGHDGPHGYSDGSGWRP